jgi:hypothetical protein
MATKSSLVSAINSKTAGRIYSSWRIGLTHDPAARRAYWRDQGYSVTYWSDWKVDSLSDAQDIEAHFIGKGMKAGTGGDLSSGQAIYVYVF